MWGSRTQVAAWHSGACWPAFRSRCSSGRLQHLDRERGQRRPRATIRSILAGRSLMRPLSRRQFIAGAGATAAATATLAPTRAPAQKSGGTLRFVAQADLKILDPVWTTAYITRNHSYLVYDTLFGTDEKLQVRPQMVDKHSVSKDGMKYTFTLRDGLKWHDGQPVVAEDCAESLKRWMKKD